jgi:hypothetical protein
VNDGNVTAADFDGMSWRVLIGAALRRNEFHALTLEPV